MSRLSLSEVLNQAWSLFKTSWLSLVGLFLLSILVSLIPFVGSLLSSLILSPALSMAALLAARRGQVSFGDAFSNIGRLLLVFVYSLVLYAVPFLLILVPLLMAEAQGYSFRDVMTVSAPEFVAMSVFGFILLFIFGIWGWAGPFFILDGKRDVFGAISASFSIVSQNLGTVILALLLVIFLNVLGAISCCLGLLVTFPLSVLFLALLYINLSEGQTPNLV